MTARQKIESLTSSWYGFAVFTALCALFRRGFGPFSLIWTMGSLIFSLTLIFFVGRRLLAKGHLTRAILLVWSTVGALAGGFGVGKTVLFGEWSFSMILTTAAIAVGVYMHARSFRVLTSESVRSYFA
ncbi:MAG TPA: hypothetical protein VNO21_09795 [Polyangiaceae bacterium]|nr:hypothetical protein [Polyangiaceae bacterium]